MLHISKEMNSWELGQIWNVKKSGNSWEFLQIGFCLLERRIIFGRWVWLGLVGLVLKFILIMQNYLPISLIESIKVMQTWLNFGILFSFNIKGYDFKLKLFFKSFKFHYLFLQKLICSFFLFLDYLMVLSYRYQNTTLTLGWDSKDC